LKNATGAAADTAAKVKAVSDVLNTQPVRYGKPGLQAHITYLAGMTARGDQKVGRDALERYQVLRKELDSALKQSQELSDKLTSLTQVLGLKESELESANLALLTELSAELSRLRTEFDRQNDRNARLATIK